MTNAQKIANIQAWQNAGYVHELTCGVDSRHEALVPEERDGEVILVCPTCQKVQTFIPPVVLQGPPPNPLEGR